MADFDVQIGGAVTVAQFDDPERAPGTLGPEDKGAPSRLNAGAAHPHLHLRVAVGGAVTVTAKGGATDAALGGRLFSSYFAERPSGTPEPIITFAPGTTSVQSWTAGAVGHYLFVMAWDAAGGRLAIHIDAE